MRTSYLVITERTKQRILALIAQHGESAVARELGVSRLTLARASAGLDLLRGTRALIENGVDAAEHTLGKAA